MNSQGAEYLRQWRESQREDEQLASDHQERAYLRSRDPELVQLDLVPAGHDEALMYAHTRTER